MSASDFEDDPVWKRVKAQSRPLKKADKPTKPLPSRPIQNAVCFPQGTKNTSTSKPVREDNHRRVRRGKIEIDKTIDLHGMNEVQAKQQLFSFVQNCHSYQQRNILVITGKGKSGAGVLRNALPGWLNSNELGPLVSGFAEAHIRHGGSGAWYVFLRKNST